MTKSDDSLSLSLSLQLVSKTFQLWPNLPLSCEPREERRRKKKKRQKPTTLDTHHCRIKQHLGALLLGGQSLQSGSLASTTKIYNQGRAVVVVAVAVVAQYARIGQTQTIQQCPFFLHRHPSQRLFEKKKGEREGEERNDYTSFDDTSRLFFLGANQPVQQTPQGVRAPQST